MERLYIAYGSNLNVGQMAYRCPDAVPVGAGTIRDWRLVFKRYADVERSTGDTVPVGVWRISSRDEKSLDRYEGYPKVYDKIMVPVYMEDGTIKFAMMYVMTPTAHGGKYAEPSYIYYDIVQEGYDNFHLDKSFLLKAVEISK